MILDCGVLVSADRNERAAVGFREQSKRLGVDLHTTAPVVAQAWRDGARQAMLARFLDGVIIHGFESATRRDERRVGELLATTGTNDVVDAHLVVMAQHLGVAVLTGDLGDIAPLADAIIGPRPTVRSWP